MKLYTIKMRKILSTYMWRVYIITIYLELCLFTKKKPRDYLFIYLPLLVATHDSI